MSFVLIAHIPAKPGKESELESLLRSLVQPTLDEPGCISYVLHKNQEASEFTFIEEWESTADLDAHFETPHLKAALPKFEALTDGLDLRKYDKL